MNKNIFLYLMIFSSLSLFSIGFSSWQIIDQNTEKSNSVVIDDVIADEIFDISDIGITASSEIGKFTYYIDSTNEDKQYYFSSTNLTFNIVADKTKMEELEYDDEKLYYLELEVFYYDNNG